MCIHSLCDIVSHAVTHYEFDANLIRSGIIHERCERVPTIMGKMFHVEFIHNRIEIRTDIESDAILMPEQIADKVPDAVATGEMWVMAVPATVRRIDYEIVDPYVPMRIDRNGTRERFLVWYGELKRVRYQDNWRNLSTRTARNQKAVEWFMENKPDISYRTFMSNMDDELLKSFHVELQEVWE